MTLTLLHIFIHTNSQIALCVFYNNVYSRMPVWIFLFKFYNYMNVIQKIENISYIIDVDFEQ